MGITPRFTNLKNPTSSISSNYLDSFTNIFRVEISLTVCTITAITAVGSSTSYVSSAVSSVLNSVAGVLRLVIGWRFGFVSSVSWSQGVESPKALQGPDGKFMKHTCYPGITKTVLLFCMAKGDFTS